jgi:kynureninase
VLEKEGNTMETKNNWDLEKDLALLRKNFPILDRCVYLISNSLGAVPAQVRDALESYFTMWAEDGVSAWDREWWMLSQRIGDQLGSLIGAEKESVTMMTSATLAHWVALSTQFSSKKKKKNKVVMTDHDFPSILYALAKICSFMDWQPVIVQSRGKPGIDVEAILECVDERTFMVATSHVYFKSAYIQDISRIARFAKNRGVLTLIDGYHGPGTIPVDVRDMDVDFYVGGCLKWLCGGPGNAFLYTRPQLRAEIEPQLTGWLAHTNPFHFSPVMEYSEGAYKLMSGTPPIPCLYTARAGLDIISRIGIDQIRKKSIVQTKRLIKEALDRDFVVHTPLENEKRGGAVSIAIPHAHQIKQALGEKNVKIDFRKGKGTEPDVIRVGPHFYTEDEEIDCLFETIDHLYKKGEYKKFAGKSELVT